VSVVKYTPKRLEVCGPFVAAHRTVNRTAQLVTLNAQYVSKKISK